VTRLAAAIALGAVALVVLVLVGRWEGDRFVDEANEGLVAVRDAVGPLDQPALTHFRLDAGLTCLVYERDGKDLALELCFDSGRLVEAVDRRGAETRRWSLRADPDAAAVFVDPDEIQRIHVRLYEDALAEARRRLGEQGS
jgi:hypothetical protein